MDFNAAIFDLDGTILDSMDVWEHIDIQFLKKRNLPVPENYVTEICARSFEEAAQYTIDLFGLQETVEGIIEEWNNMAVEEYSNHVGLLPHALDYLLRLKEHGIKLAVATGLPEKLYMPCLKNNSILELFDALCSTDIEQREGRIIRQGNENEEVNIYRYVTKGSFDAYLWGIVETKQRFISQVFTSRELARICEDIDETVLNFAEIKAVASENPLIMEKIQVDNEVARLRILKAAHEGKRFALQDAVTFQYPKRIQSLKGELQLLQKDLERRNQAMEVQPGFAITLQGKVYEKHKEAGEVLRGIIEGVTAFTRHEVGMYKGFQVSVQNDMLGPILFLQGEKEYSVELKSSDSGNMVRIENRLNALDKAVEDVQKEIKTCENEIKNAKQEYEKPFPYEELLKENITRQMEIDAELEIKDQEECVEVQEETRNLPCQTAVR
jgi:phosphoserine phosphatase